MSGAGERMPGAGAAAADAHASGDGAGTGASAAGESGYGTRAKGIRIRDLTLELGPRKNPKRILRGIDLDVTAGSIAGLAGESGSGKTMTGLAVCGLQPAGARLGGTIEFDGPRGRVPNLLDQGPRAMNRLRGRDIAMIFQDPTASLHPMITVEGQLTDGMRRHLRLGRTDARKRAIELLERVHVPDPAGACAKYPHQFSGGQLQRIAIAIALSCGPSVLIADEPTTALDVTVQAGVLRLLRELCDSLDLAILLVTHDLGVMSALADTVTVMRYGEVVEHGDRYQVIREPRSDYTRSLIEALPNAPAPASGVGGVPGADAVAASVTGASAAASVTGSSAAASVTGEAVAVRGPGTSTAASGSGTAVGAPTAAREDS